MSLFISSLILFSFCVFVVLLSVKRLSNALWCSAYNPVYGCYGDTLCSFDFMQTTSLSHKHSLNQTEEIDYVFGYMCSTFGRNCRTF